MFNFYRKTHSLVLQDFLVLFFFLNNTIQLCFRFSYKNFLNLNKDYLKIHANLCDIRRTTGLAYVFIQILFFRLPKFLFIPFPYCHRHVYFLFFYLNRMVLFLLLLLHSSPLKMLVKSWVSRQHLCMGHVTYIDIFFIFFFFNFIQIRVYPIRCVLLLFPSRSRSHFKFKRRNHSSNILR